VLGVFTECSVDRGPRERWYWSLCIISVFWLMLHRYRCREGTRDRGSKGTRERGTGGPRERGTGGPRERGNEGPGVQGNEGTRDRGSKGTRDPRGPIGPGWISNSP
jgi:hypothetical protein